MKLIRNKWLALVLAVVMLVGTVGMGFAYTSETEELFESLKAKYITPFLSDRLNYASDMYVALDAINENELTIENSIKSAFNTAYTANPVHFDTYGFDTAQEAVDVYYAFKDQLPVSLNALTTTATGNIFFKLYNDPDSIVYSEYVEDYKMLTTTILSEFPQEFQDEFELLAPTADEKAKLILAAIDGFGITKIGSAVKSSTGVYSVDLNTTAVNTTVKNAILTKINAITTDHDMSMSFLDAYFSVISSVLEGVEDSLTTQGSISSAINVLNKINLITYTIQPVDPVDPGTGGGGGGGGIAPPPMAPPVEQPIPTPEKPTDTTPNPDATYTSLAMRQALQLLNSDVLTQAKVDPVLEELEKEVLAASQDIVENLQIVERAEALVAKLLENDSLTDQGAINYANQILTQFIAPAITKDAMGGTHHELEALAASLIESVLERIGSMDAADVITDAMVKAAVSEQNNALVMMDEGLSAIFTDAEIAALSQNVSVELNGTIVKLDPAAVAYMKSNDIGIKVMTDSVAMTLPAAMMDSVRAGLSLVVELEPKSGSGLGNKMANGAQGTVGAAYELSVYLVNDQNAVVEVLSSVRPLVSLPVGNFRTNMHTVGAYYLNESTGEWEYVRSHVVNNRVVFQAPHLSTYGVLQRNIGFSDMTSHWAKSVIEELAVKGVVSGRSLTEYEPNGTITRAEFATILVQALQLEGDVKVTFNDVYSSDWYYEYVNVAALHGLVSGVGSGKFDPNAKITRQDMAIMIMKAYEKRIGTSVKSVAVEIKDISAVSQYAKDRVLAARFNQLIGGYPDGSFMPLANATRAEAGQMVKNLMSK